LPGQRAGAKPCEVGKDTYRRPYTESTQYLCDLIR
jgi:hypothetical protein